MERVRPRNFLIARIGVLFLTLCCLLQSAPAQQRRQPDFLRDLKGLPENVQKALKAMPKLRYSGKRIVEFKFGPTRSRHEEYVIKDGPNLRIEFPPDSKFRGQVIVENRRERRHYLPDENEIRVSEPRREEAAFRLWFLVDGVRNGTVKINEEGKEAIAGHSADKIGILKEGQVLQRLWIDPDSGMVLKRELFDHVGTMVGLFEYTQIDYNPRVDESDFQISVPGATVVTPEMMAQRLARKHGFTYMTLPKNEGLRLESARIIESDDTPILLYSYRGRRTRLTLYQLHREVNSDKLKMLSRGRVHSYTWTKNGEYFALLGNFEVDQLRRLASKFTAGQ